MDIIILFGIRYTFFKSLSSSLADASECKRSLDQDISMLSIQQRLKLERQKMLMNTLSPMC
jgi:hypothetical protein